jgi:hypothetical protein
MELENVKAALKWALDNGVVASSWEEANTGTVHRSLSDGGCGCCAGEADVPDELRATIYEVLGWT